MAPLGLKHQPKGFDTIGIILLLPQRGSVLHRG